MKIGRAEFVEDIHVPGLRVRRPVQLSAGEYDRTHEQGTPPPTTKAVLDMSLGDRDDVPRDWLALVVDGRLALAVPAGRVAAVYPPEPEPEEEKLGPPNSTIIPGDKGGARQHPAQGQRK